MVGCELVVLAGEPRGEAPDHGAGAVLRRPRVLAARRPEAAATRVRRARPPRRRPHRHPLPYPHPVGLRDLLHVVALGLLAASPLVVIGRRRWRLVLLGVLAVGQLAFFWQSQPHSLAWTAPPFRPGYRFTTDSNVDWGQDFYRLQDWAKGKRPVVLYFGPLEPVPNLPGSEPLFIPTDQEGVLAALDPQALRGRWLAVSATALTSYYRPVLGWLRAYCPVGNLGGSILLYRFDEPPDYDRRGPVRPAAPCRGNVSRPST